MLRFRVGEDARYDRFASFQSLGGEVNARSVLESLLRCKLANYFT